MEEKKIIEFITQSNYIEREYSAKSLKEALEAWEWLAKKHLYSKKPKKLTVEDVLKVHSIMFKSKKLIHVGAKIYPFAGSFRYFDVWIGGNKKAYISDDLLREEVKSWVYSFNVRAMLKSGLKVTKKQVIENHVHFESVHPFGDGNGRVGRMFYLLLLLKRDLPVKVIHEGKQQMEYYNWFN